MVGGRVVACAALAIVCVGAAWVAWSVISDAPAGRPPSVAERPVSGDEPVVRAPSGADRARRASRAGPGGAGAPTEPATRPEGPPPDGNEDAGPGHEALHSTIRAPTTIDLIREAAAREPGWTITEDAEGNFLGEWRDDASTLMERHELRSGWLHGLRITRDERGGGRTEVTYEYGARHGPCAKRRADGTYRERGNYASDAQDGVWESWFADGARHGERTYVDGKLEGVVRSWRADGSLIQESHYSAGADHGICRGFHANGKPWFEMPYDRGARQGEAKWWRADGTLEATATYRDGRLHGPFHTYDARGRIRGTEHWSGGVLVTTEGDVTFANDAPEDDPALGELPR
ncbi:MAG: hypothetical protein HMLKMBBP_01233 [Planctomycetes bacterium]|nr:hypothetical protein [Planctomycetota bacterium]